MSLNATCKFWKIRIKLIMAKILIIEDEAIVARMYQKSLSFAGFDTVVAVGGKEGLAKAVSERPDIVLLDIMMPEPNGMEVLTALKLNSETINIPVVMLTNLSGRHDAKLALSKGAIEFWVKSEIELKDLGKKISEIVNNHGKKTLVKH